MTAWIAGAWLVALTHGAAAGSAIAEPPVTASVTPELPSMWMPPQQREMTRVEGVMRPFLGVSGNSWGAITDARIEHYFRRPFMLGLELSPLALASSSQGTGAITHLRLHAAYVTDHIALGFAAGERFRRIGTAGGVSLAPTLRLGSLDGLNFNLSYGYTIARNQYTGKPTLGFSNLLGTLSVPLNRRLALVTDVGFSLDIWAFGTLGLRQRLAGDGGPGTWLMSGAFGLAWVSDRTICNFEAEVPCPGRSALSWGPVVSFGLERRF